MFGGEQPLRRNRRVNAAEICESWRNCWRFFPSLRSNPNRGRAAARCTLGDSARRALERAGDVSRPGALAAVDRLIDCGTGDALTPRHSLSVVALSIVSAERRGPVPSGRCRQRVPIRIVAADSRARNCRRVRHQATDVTPDLSHAAARQLANRSCSRLTGSPLLARGALLIGSCPHRPRRRTRVTFREDPTDVSSGRRHGCFAPRAR